MHHPATFDTVASLALLQEEVSHKHREHRRMDFSVKGSVKGAHPLLAPPLYDKKPLSVFPEEKKLFDGKTTEEKLAALRAYRRAKGLCIPCAEKWSRDHKCSAMVQLNVVQELLELFNLEEMEEIHRDSASQAQLFAGISKEALSGKEGPRTMRLLGQIQNEEVLILVDSDSSRTFVSQHIATKMFGVQALPQSVSVQVANGEILSCSHGIPKLSGLLTIILSTLI